MAAHQPPQPPVVAPAPPPPLGAPPTAPILTFMERYRDQRFDLDNDDNRRLLAEFDPMAVNARTSDDLRTAVLSENDMTSRAILAHWQDGNKATRPGRIVVLHGFKRYPYSLAVGPTAWDNLDFCWYQDMVDTAPPTPFGLPSSVFCTAELTPGVLNLRVYTAPTLAAMYAANPNLVVGPCPAAGDAGTAIIRTRYAFPLPFRYVAGLLLRKTQTPDRLSKHCIRQS